MDRTIFSPEDIGVTSCWGTGARVPFDFQQFNFSVNFRAALSLPATLCGCLWRSVTLICGALEEHLLTYLLSKHIMYSASAAAVVQSRLSWSLFNVLFIVILCATKGRGVLCPSVAPDSGDAADQKPNLRLPCTVWKKGLQKNKTQKRKLWHSSFQNAFDLYFGLWNFWFTAKWPLFS